MTEQITLTSKPSREEVQKAAEMLLYQSNLTAEEWDWACTIIRESKRVES